jgi:hypothetical protein
VLKDLTPAPVCDNCHSPLEVFYFYPGGGDDHEIHKHCSNCNGSLFSFNPLEYEQMK